jgi:general secretion pathway protein A
MLMKAFYGLAENPFALTPDPRFISWSHTHRETFQHLTRRHQGHKQMIVVTGDSGTGKTTLLYALRAYLQAHAKQTPISLLPLSVANVHDLFTRMANDLGLERNGREMVDYLPTLNEFFIQHLQADERIVLLLDAAQDVPDNILEEVGLLASIGTPQEKLFHIVLASPPSLQDRLNAPRFLHIKARVGVVCHLAPLNLCETEAYITRRLEVAGLPEKPIFHPEAIAEIYRFSQGIPRAINILCNQALLRGFFLQSSCIDAEIILHTVQNPGFYGVPDFYSNHHKEKSDGNLAGMDEKQIPSDADGAYESQEKPRQLASRSNTRRFPVALLSLGVTLLVAAGTFLTLRGMLPERAAQLHALAPPPWGKRLPTVLDGMPESMSGLKDQRDIAAAAVQRAPAPASVPTVTPPAPVTSIPVVQDAMAQAETMSLDMLSRTMAASIRARISKASACNVTPSAPSSQGQPGPICGPRVP